MKILTITGTRPELIRLSRIIPLLDQHCEHILVHTGQNFSANLKDVFFEELDIRQPDYYLDATSTTPMKTIGNLFGKVEAILAKEKPHKILILGDTNSGLSAFVAKRLGIPVYHMEAGNRCFDQEVPEEVNRPVIDVCSDILLPYTHNSRQYLINEGYQAKKIIVTGNPIHEVLDCYMPKIDQSNILKALELNEKNYFLVTLHREENVDHKDRLAEFIKTFDLLAEKYSKQVIISIHPRTKERLRQYKISAQNPSVKFIDAIGFVDFIRLQKGAFCVLSDSGTVPEECAILGIPNVLLRTSTERPELLEAGSTIISGRKSSNILTAVSICLAREKSWGIPNDYKSLNVSHKVLKVLLSQ